MLKSRNRRPRYSQNGNYLKNPLLKAKKVYSWGAERVQAGVSKQAKRISGDNKMLEKLAYLSSLAFAGMVVGLFLIIAVVAFYSRELPNPDTLLERSAELSTKFYDRNGELLYEVFGEKNRTLVPIEEIPEDVKHATLTIEDSEFYLHQGFSLRGMARAIRNMLLREGGIQSGSTLTQQVIKNTLLTHEQTLARKIKEVILSLQLENRYSKDDILQMYLNESPYGGQNYGIYSAAKAYFNKEPKDLTLPESAYLAGLPQSPSVYSQFGVNPEAGIERKNYVLYLMNERGWVGPDGKRYYLSNDEYEAALEQDLEFDTAKVPLAAPHFTFYAKQVLTDMFGEAAVEQGGLRVTTTLDLEAHNLAQEILSEEVESAQDLNVWNGSMVVIDPRTAQILSMVGSKGYNLDPQPEGCTSGIAGEDGCKFDPYLNVTLAARQPGSAIKPITYATMLSQGYTASFPLLDVPTVFQGSAPDKPYIPENYDGEFRGPMSLRRSLANSLNIPAVKALKIVGIDNMIDTAEKMGITTFTDRSRYGLALTLGGGEVKLLELTGAFSVFASKGIYRVPTPILKVEDAYGNTLYEWQDTGGIRALGEDVSFLVSDILSDDGARSAVFGFGSALNIPGHQVAVKTGTTDDKRDNYALGFTPSVVVGVWVGNNNNEKMNPYVASGITGATPIWHRFMAEYLKDKDTEKFEPPENIEKHEVDELTGMKPFGDFGRRMEWFIKGTEPTAPSDWYKRLEICKVDGRIANDDCDDADRTEEKTYIDIQAALPEWQSAVDAWVKENYGDDDKYYPPKMKSKLEFDGDDVSNENEVFAQIVGLDDGDTVPLYFRLSVETSSYRDIEEVRIYMDGNLMTADRSEPYGYNFELGLDAIGEHEFSATAEDEKGNKGDDKIRLEVSGWNL